MFRHTLRRSRASLAISAAITAVLTILAVGTTAGTAAARTSRPAGLDRSSSDAPRTLVATGIGRIQGVPDVLVVSLGVTSRGDTVGDALARNNTVAAALLEALTGAGVDKKDVQTSNFSIGPVFGDRSPDVVGYQVSNVVTVRLRDLATAGSIIDQAAKAGGDDAVVHGVSFEFDDSSDLVAQARADAVRRARTQAQQLAAAADVELGEVRKIAEPTTGSARTFDDSLQARGFSTSVPIEPGSEELTVQVSVIFAIR